VIEAAIAFLAGIAGLFAVSQRLRHEFSIAATVLTTLLLFAATSLFWSMTRAASPTEAVVFAVVSVLAMIAARSGPRSVHVVAWSLLSVLPIVVIWGGAAATGEPATGLPAGNPLSSSGRGLFSLTPITYVAAIGMLMYGRRDRSVALASVLVVTAWVATSSVLVSTTRHPFDHQLTAALPLLAPGLASIIETARSKPLIAVVPLIAIFPLWNYWLMVQYTAGMLPKDEPVSFAAMVRQQAEVHTRSPYAYPFAFPANVLYAWREGVPVDRYELLAGEPRRAAFALTMDHSADRFLIDGWGSAAPPSPARVRWTSGRRASLTFPLQPPQGDIAIVVTAAARAEDPTVSVAFAVEVNGREIGRATAAPAPADTQFVVRAADVRQVLREGYNRLTIVNHTFPRPLDVYGVRVGPAS
jgi:hypothetical protein